MSKPKDVTQKTFQPHLLAALGELVDYTAGTSVPFTETYAPVCERMGITEDQYGQCETHEKPWTHRLIGLAFRTLRDKGLGDYEKKGHWALTQMGVQKARENAGLPASIVTSKPVVAAPVHTAARVTALAETGSSADVLRLPTVHPYHNDPYLRALAIERTPCFGAFSSRSETCKTCPLSEECTGAGEAAKAKIAADMEAEDARLIAAKTAKEKAKADKNESIDDLISSFDEVDDGATKKKAKKSTKSTGKKPSKATAQREGICCRCQGAIKKGAECYWIKGEGIMHADCLDD
jgi:uncharacterized protein YdaT